MTSQSEEPEESEEDRECEGCGKIFRISSDSLFAHCRLCDKCEEKARQDEARAKHEARTRAAWESTVPKEYRETRTDHPDYPLPMHKVCHLWLKGDDIGQGERRLCIGLIGESGQCKTRVISQLVKRMIWEGSSVLWVNSSKWQWDVQHLHDDTERVECAKRIKAAKTASILVFDDIGSLKSTEAVSDNLYALLEHRTAHGLPMLWTSNETIGEMLAGKGISEKARKRNISRLAGFSNILEL